MEEIANKSGKEGSFLPIIIVMVFSLLIASLWEKIPAIKNTVGFLLDPTAGALLGLNLTIGMLVIVAFLSLAITLIQKYATDQKTIREMKEEQKKLNEEAKKFRHDPQKMMEMQKEGMKFAIPMMKLSTRALVFTGVPFILLFRWFMDYFSPLGFLFFGFLNWFWFYLIFSIIFSSIFRKIFNVV